jgi:hypothetical protein
MAALLNAHIKVFGLENMLSPMPVPVSRQLAAPAVEGEAAMVTATAAPKVVSYDLSLVGVVDITSVTKNESITRILRKQSAGKSSLDTEVTVLPKLLRRLERDAFRNLGVPHVLLTIDCTTKDGNALAQAIKSSGYRDARLPAGNWKLADGNSWWLKKGKVTMVLTQRHVADFWKKCNFDRPACDFAGIMKTTKRMRRSLASVMVSYTGKTVSKRTTKFYFETGENIEALPCDNNLVEITEVSVNGIAMRLPEPIYTTLRFPEATAQLVSLTDGSHLGDHREFNRINRELFRHIGANTTSMRLLRKQTGISQEDLDSLEALTFREGDGLQMTCELGTPGRGKGQSKGNMPLTKLAGRTLAILLDTNHEFQMEGDTVRFGIMQVLHKSDPAHLDLQSDVSFGISDGGFSEEWGNQYLGSIEDRIGDPAKLAAFSKNIIRQAELMEADDIANCDDDEGYKGLKKQKWALADLVSMLDTKLYLSTPEGLTTFNYDDTNAAQTPFSPWGMPKAAERLFRHLTEEVMNINRWRIPIPATMGQRGYFAFDISTVRHTNRRLDGNGIFLSQGVLKGRTAACFGKVPVPSTEKVDAYTSVLLEGPACCHRQPNGWLGEMLRNLQLVYAAFYSRMNRTPFIFLSMDRVPVEGEFEAFLVSVLGQAKVDKLHATWDVMVPYIVIALLLLGGGDLDDAAVTYTGTEIVKYFQAQKQRVLDYPNADLELDSKSSALAAVGAIGGRFANLVKQHQAVVGYDETGLAMSITKLGEPEMVGIMTNPGMIFNNELNRGHHTPVCMGPYNRNLDVVIDRSVKTGEDIGGAHEHAKEFNKKVDQVSLMLSSRVDRKRLDSGEVKIVLDRRDCIKASLIARIDALKQAFQDTFLNPLNAQRLTYMTEYPVSVEAAEYGRAWYNRYLEVLATEKDKSMAFLQQPAFDKISEADKANDAIRIAYKAADKAAFTEFYTKPYLAARAQGPEAVSAFKLLMIEAVIYNYNRIFSPTSIRFNDDGTTKPIGDAFLLGEYSHTLLRTALRYAKICKMTGEYKEVAEYGTLDPEVLAPVIQGPALDITNGIRERVKNGEIDQAYANRWVALATDHTPVVIKHLDPDSMPDMNLLWEQVPAFAGQRREAFRVTLQHGEAYGWVFSRNGNFAKFHHYVPTPGASVNATLALTYDADGRPLPAMVTAHLQLEA